MLRILQNVQRGLRQVHHNQPIRTSNVSQQNKLREEGINGESQQLQVASYHGGVSSGAAGTENGNHKEREDWGSFRQKFNWSSCESCKHNMFEALGWGTALVVSLHVCRQFDRADQWRCDDDRKRFWRALYRFAQAMPKGLRPHPTTRRSILEDGKNHQDSVTTETPQDLQAEALSQLESLGNESTGLLLNALGLNYAIEGSLVKAAGQFRQAADVGYAKSMYNLGVCYEEGKGVPKSLSKAADYYKSAAEKGHPMALYNLAVFYLLGLGGLPKDSKKAMELMELAAEKGLQQAVLYMGTYYLEEPHVDVERAVSFLEEGSKDKDADCLYYLGMCYEQGWGVAQNEAKAADLYSKAAKQNHCDAQYNLAVFNELGLGGLPEDREYARELYRVASQSGSELAVQCLERLDVEDKLKLEEETSKLEQSQILENSTEKTHLVAQEKRPIHTSMSSPSLSSMAQEFDCDQEHFEKPEWISKRSISVLDLFLPSILSYKGMRSSCDELKNNNQDVAEISADFDGEGWLADFGVKEDVFKMNGLRGSFGVAVV